MSKFSSAIIIVSLALSSLALADTVSFSSPGGDRGASQTYTLDGVTITATGFNGGDLFGKSLGGNENGLGLTGDPTTDNEIFFKSMGTQDFIQLDVLNLLNANFTAFQFQMNSSTSPDAWSVSACSVSGTDCFTSPATGTDQNAHNAPASLSKTNHYLDFSATGGNVLLSSLSATPPSVPEPRFYGLLLVALLGVAGVILRNRRSTENA
jgi:hypothetical protein